MEVHFSPDLEVRINRAAARKASNPGEYVQQIVEHYLDHEAWFVDQVKSGIDQLDRGEVLTHEEVGIRINQLFRS